jgi:lipoate-protein ligase B
VNTDLSYFQRIVPCGLTWAEVTSMQKELGKEHNLSAVQDRFLHHFAEVFGYSDIEESVDTLTSGAKQATVAPQLEPETRNSELETA